MQKDIYRESLHYLPYLQYCSTALYDDIDSALKKSWHYSAIEVVICDHTGRHITAHGPKWFHIGDKVHLINNHIHNEYGPAVIKSNGTVLWYYKDRLHRDNGPAIISQDHMKWYQNDKLHRTDGPAVFSCKKIEWHVNDMPHCIDIEYADDPINEYWQNDMFCDKYILDAYFITN